MASPWSEYFAGLREGVPFGSGWFTIDGERCEALPGRLLWAPNDEVHAIEAGPDGLRFMASVGPNEDRPDEEIQVTDGSAR